MTSLTSPPDTIRLRSRIASQSFAPGNEAGDENQPPRRSEPAPTSRLEVLVDGGTSTNDRAANQADQVIDLRVRSDRTPTSDTAWLDHDAFEALPYEVEDRSASTTASAPSVRFDNLLATQEISAVDLGLDVETFAPAKPRTTAQRFIVRSLDIVVALVALVVALPIMLAVALAVHIDSEGPIFYGSGRIGHRKPTFHAWKFRSMRPDADEALQRLLQRDSDARLEYEMYHKLHDDPRLTRVGGFIRRTSLDELPQLYNVLKGEMSLVGPRPKLPVDAEAYGAALGTVLSVRPGLTGLWQVSGRNDVSMEDRVRLDLEYVHTRTIAGDLGICLRTAIQLCQPHKHGAY